ncbi:MAG: hypothetical protein R3272_12355 [Candidatus Promineifilaceae bacterium]|nr:hypothetical protein [Candidatus Promineifilaceae bacterium]
MAEVTLREYLQRIDELVDESRLTEAAAHCRHILEAFPRHVGTYRALAKVLLEQGAYADAADLFWRVLSADPEDFIAHVGLAIIYQDDGDLKEALWHMERAFEMDPYNAAIHEELRSMYGRRDGLAPERVMLTRGALARLHVNGELYQQAVSEIQELLAEEGERVDLRTLLAEALWRDGQRVDAVEVSLDLVQELPNCITANAILAEVWLATGRVQEAEAYLERLQALTQMTQDALRGDSPLVHAFRAEGAIPLPEQITLDVLPEEAVFVPAGTDEAGEWVDELDFVPEEERGAGDLDWLTALESDEGLEEAEAFAGWESQTGEHGEGQEQREPAAEEWELDVPDWLDEDEQESEPAAAAGESVEFAGEGAADFAAEEEEFEWEEQAMGATDERGNEPEDFTEEEWSLEQPSEEIPGLAEGEEDLDWLAELEDTGATGSAAESEAGEPAAEEEFPAWLLEGLDEADEEVSLDWLEEAESVGDFALEEEGEPLPADVPDWLAEMAPDEAAGDEAPAEELSMEELSAELPDEDLSWLDQIATGEGAAIEEGPTMSWPETEAEEELPDWLAEEETEPEPRIQPEAAEAATGVEAPTGAETEAEVSADVAAEAEQAPVIEAPAQVEAPGGAEPPEDLDEALAWLESLAAQQGAPLEELPSLTESSVQAAAETLAEETGDAHFLEDMPENVDDALSWLDEVAGEPVAAAVPEREEPGDIGEAEPDWLDELAEETPETAGLEAEAEDWLTEVAFEEEAVEPLAAAEIAGEETPTAEASAGAEVPEDLDDAMAWLEQLAADQGAPLDELPSLQEAGTAEPEEALAEHPEPARQEEAWLDELSEEVEAEAAEAPEDELGWLEDMPVGDEEDLSWLEDLEEAAAEPERAAAKQPPAAAPSEKLPVAEGEMEVAAEAAPDLVDIPEDVDEAMAWLEKLAAQQGAPLEELPSLEEQPAEQSVGEAISDLAEEIPDDPDEALSWLQELIGEGEPAPAAPVVEEPDTPVAPQDVVAARAAAEAQLARERREVPLPEEVEEPAETGVEALEAPAEEPPAIEEPAVAEAPVADRVEAETEILEEMPEDPDEAMAWLERLAARQGAPVEELPSLQDEVGAPVEAEEVAPAESVPAEHELEEAWLDELRDEVEDDEPVEPLIAAATVEAVEAGAELEIIDELPDEMMEDAPDDLDAALAWLEGLAAQQGAPLDELPSVKEGQEAEMPAWLAEELTEAEAQAEAPAEEPAAETAAVDEEPAAEEAAEAEPLAEGAPEEAPVEIEQPAEDVFTIEEELFAEEDFLAELDLGEDEMDDSLPDWLTMSVAGEPGADFDWGDEEEVDVSGWLQAEEEITQHELPVTPTRPLGIGDFEPVSREAPPAREEEPAEGEAPAAEEPVGAQEPAVEAQRELPATQPLAVGAELDRDRLERARHALYTDRYEVALEEYEVLVQEGKDLIILIADLKDAASSQPKEARLRRLLGDAYMENGQLQKALEEYQQALELL